MPVSRLLADWMEEQAQLAGFSNHPEISLCRIIGEAVKHLREKNPRGTGKPGRPRKSSRLQPPSSTQGDRR